MRNFKLEITYRGSRYHGFQMQSNAVTIQGEIEKALKLLMGERIVVHGCSRTDKGVHANSYILNIRTSHKITPIGIVKGLNAFLPDDIVVLNCEEVHLDFHARFDAVAKEYIYRISNSKVPSPFLHELVLQHPYKLDHEKMLEGAGILIGEHDFASFCASGSKILNTVRTIHRIDIERNSDMIEITICGDGFLYNMVRIIVGTLIFYSDGKLSKDDIQDMIDNPDRKKAGKTVSPYGLYLNKVYY